MEILLLVPGSPGRWGQPLPALELLDHAVRVGPDDRLGRVTDAVLVDARPHPREARETCRTLRFDGLAVPLIAVVAESGLASVTADWGLDDIVLAGAGPGELQSRLQMAAGRLAARTVDGPIEAGRLTIDPRSFSVTVGGRRVALAFREFELLKFLALHPGQVFTRERLLREVWGYDFAGGHRTVDMHVRRLRSKLGPGNEFLIATVRQVGYRLGGTPEVDIFKDSTCDLYRSELQLRHGICDDHLQP
ncbi:response regulator transcription factor [Paractinoplanes durhamensis]|uniref:Transcriptional regulatory protein GlnR n=1 Tax=Paractinoplanes durhamensis TaxID=113563 RepID=A0ABQ3YY05_9ACTN|nr:response regulator transcription factor [Actinoplanes durhamensis]GIE02447.1 transcriptional regulatory protein GlnR [Actinoplanes durhamensis]